MYLGFPIVTSSFSGVSSASRSSSASALSFRICGIIALNKCFKLVLSHPYNMGLVIVLNIANTWTRTNRICTLNSSLINGVLVISAMSLTEIRIKFFLNRYKIPKQYMYWLEITFLPLYWYTFCQPSVLILWTIWKISM